MYFYSEAAHHISFITCHYSAYILLAPIQERSRGLGDQHGPLFVQTFASLRLETLAVRNEK